MTKSEDHLSKSSVEEKEMSQTEKRCGQGKLLKEKAVSFAAIQTQSPDGLIHAF